MKPDLSYINQAYPKPRPNPLARMITPLRGPFAITFTAPCPGCGADSKWHQDAKSENTPYKMEVECDFCEST